MCRKAGRSAWEVKMESKIRHAVYANTADTNLSPKTVFVID